MKNLIIRAVSGAVYIALIIAAILVNQFTFIAFFSILLIIGMCEFNKLVSGGQRKTIAHAIDILTGISLIGATYATAMENVELPKAAIFPIGCLIARLISGLYLKEQSPIKSWADSFMNILYVAVPLCLLVVLYSTIGKIGVLLMFAFIWLNDTGAYLVGCSIGKHRLFERISPKKSWEGFFGGLAFCIIAGVAASHFLNEPLSKYIIFGIVVSTFATWGDLIESLIKRTVGVKDSGNIMPGHGGILDRIDSLLLVAPAVLMYFLLLNF